MKRFALSLLPRVLLTALLAASFIAGLAAWAKDPDQGGGIGGTGITGIGHVQRFGSIFVNGREYFLDARTRVTIDDEAQTEDALRLGDLAVVRGHVNAHDRSEADSVAVRHALVGRVETIDMRNARFALLGQTVQVSAATFGGGRTAEAFDLAALKTGDTVTVSGFARSDGVWTATRVQRTEGTPPRFLLRGAVHDLDRTHGRLAIGRQVLSIDPARLPAALASGETARVTGVYRDGKAAVTSVTHERLDLGAAGTRVELSGYVQSRLADGDIIVQGLRLAIGKDTRFVDAGPAALGHDVAITVQGRLLGDGHVAVEHLAPLTDLNRITVPHSPDGSRPSPAMPERDRTLPDHPNIERPMRPMF